MPSGGKRAGAGRKRRLTPAQQEEVARAYRYRMEVWTATQAHVRDPNIKKRREIDKQMRKLAKTHMAVPGDDGGASFFKEDVIWFHKQVRAEMEKLQAE